MYQLGEQNIYEILCSLLGLFLSREPGFLFICKESTATACCPNEQYFDVLVSFSIYRMGQYFTLLLHSEFYL